MRIPRRRFLHLAAGAAALPTAVEALADPLVRSRIAERQTPETLAGLQKADAEKWWPIIKEAE